ncbi:MAG: hypothetical protein K2G17_07930, partial [Duncaniella sp.]|nr:hypothetical protein [Duncaniella sp.]
MLRKLTLLLLTLLPAAINGQLATGSWKVYPAFGTPDRLIETPQFVYLATSGSLHSYDKVNDESRVFEPQVDIAAGRIKDIFYNFDRHYLFVAYEDGNIDIIPDEGERINLPDIRNANVDSKTINDVKFGDGKIYIATSFGFVIYNDNSFEVDESGIFNVNVTNIAITPDNIILVTNPREWTYYVTTSPKNGQHHTIDKFTFLVQIFSAPKGLVPLGNNDPAGDTHFAVYCNNTKLYHLSIAANNRSATLEETPVTNTKSIFTADDGVYAIADGKLLHFTAPWTQTLDITLPEPLLNNAISTTDGPKSLWAADASGLANYLLEENGSLTVMRDRYRPADATTFSDISHIIPLTDNRGFMIANHGMSAHFAVGNGDFLDLVYSGNMIEDGNVTDIDATEDLTFKSSASADGRRTKGDYIFSPTFLLEDPDDHAIHYIGSGIEGIYVVKD